MGRESMSQYGSFFVVLDRSVYSPGDQVCGTVFLDCLLDFPTSQITLKLEGKEKIKFWKSRQVYSHTDRDGNTHYRTEWYPVYDSHRCFNYEFPVGAFNGPFIQRGQYQIPFTFNLPNHIPSTFHYKWHRNGDCYAKIHYEAKAKMESLHGKDLLKHKLMFTVNAAQTHAAMTKRVDIDKEVVSWCCCNQGKFKMTAYFEKDSYMPGESAYLVLEAENNSKVKCKTINGNFIQDINIHGWGGGSGDKRNLRTVKIPGMEPGEAWVGGNAKRIEIALTGTTIKQGEDAGTNNTTVHGKLIQCNYYISAQTEMEACICCDEHPTSKIYIDLYNPVPPPTAAFQPPPQWQPQVFDTYVAQLQPQFQVKLA